MKKNITKIILLGLLSSGAFAQSSIKEGFNWSKISCYSIASQDVPAPVGIFEQCFKI